METAMLVRDAVMQDEAALSPLDGAVVEVELAARRADAAELALRQAEGADGAAGRAIQDGLRAFLVAMGCGQDGDSWAGQYIGMMPRDIDGAVARLEEVCDRMLATARAHESKAAALPDARALRRMHAAAKSLRYHAQRVKEGK